MFFFRKNRILILTKQKPVETVKELAKYLEIEVTDEQINSLLNFVAFDNMKQLPSMAFNVLDVYFHSDLNFFKKGKIGTWKNHLTEEQSKRIDEVMRQNLKYKKPIQYEPTVSIESTKMTESAESTESTESSESTDSTISIEK